MKSVFPLLSFHLLFALTSCNLFVHPEHLPENNFSGAFLHVGEAIYKGSPKEVERLLKERGLSVNDVGDGGDTGIPTFLLYALRLEKPKMVAKLLEMGADPEQYSIMSSRNLRRDGLRDFFLEHPLGFASARISNQAKAKKLCALLIDAGADVNGFGTDHYAPLGNAPMYHENSKTMLDFFLSKGADMNAPLSKSGDRVLHFMSSGKWDLVDDYLEKGADPTLLHSTGWDFMFDVALALKNSNHDPQIVAIKEKLMKDYQMPYPPVQREEEGRAQMKAFFRSRGWISDEENWLVIPAEVPHLKKLDSLRKLEKAKK